MPDSQSQKSVPTSNPPIRLNLFVLWVVDDVLNPLVHDPDAVRTLSRVLKVFSLREVPIGIYFQRTASTCTTGSEWGRCSWGRGSN